MEQHQKKLGRLHGAGLLATTLLGSSVFILPEMTVNIAGDNALFAWLFLTMAILPVTLIFARLSSQYPHAGGPSYFVEQAMGANWGKTIGMIFLFVVPIGAPASIIMTYHFVDALLAVPKAYELPIQLGFIAFLFVLNYRGLQVSAILQLSLTIAIITVVMALLLGDLVQGSSTGFALNSSLEYGKILAAAGIAFWSFLGVEAMSHLSTDFDNPKRDFVPAVMVGTLIVGAIYVGCTYLVGQTDTSDTLAMVTVFDRVFGAYGALVISVLGIAGGVATVNVYTASLTKLMWSLSHQGMLPAFLQKRNSYGVAQRALSLLLLTMAVVIVASHYLQQDLERLLALVNGVFVVIYFASMLSAYKLLDKSNHLFTTLGCLFCLMLAVGLGQDMLYVATLLVILYPLIAIKSKRTTKKISPSH